MILKHIKIKKGGYTIIETMIAVSLFVVVVMTGMGALLNANLIHKKSQNMRSIMDSLNFIMEDMSKNLRTGYNYRCYDSANPWTGTDAQTNVLNTAQRCSSGGGTIVFEEAHGISIPSDPMATDQWVYFIGTIGSQSGIFKSIDGGSNFIKLTPDEVVINMANTKFVVEGAEPPPGDVRQPYITIILDGTITTNNNVVTPFSLQTSVSQRMIDI